MQTPSGFSYLSQSLPRLATTLPRVPLGDFPTPIRRLNDADCRLYVKCDDLSDLHYGGNKLRKLEYLFGQALGFGASNVATFGAANSNHALATAVHARRLGLKPIAFLSQQKDNPKIADTLALHQALGTEIVYWGGDLPTRRSIIRTTMRAQAGRTWVIPVGGSSWVGAIGYINAAFELRSQIDSGTVPQPDRIYVPLGTMGTVAGLAIGLDAAGIDATLVAVRVVATEYASQAKLATYMNKIRTLCARHEPRLAQGPASVRIEYRDDQIGNGYAHPTPAAIDAVAVARQRWRMSLETTYSGKAMAALLSDCDAGRLKNKTTLFWNTYNSVTPLVPAHAGNPSRLPAQLSSYMRARE